MNTPHETTIRQMRFIGADGSLGFRKNSVYTIQIIHTITVFGEMVRIDNVEDFKMRCEYRSYDRFLENWEDLKFKSEKVKEEWVELYKIAFIPKANDVKDYKLEEARHNAIIGFIHTQRSLAQQEGYEQCKKELLANRDARCDDCKAVGYSSCSNCESKVDPLLKIEKKITQQEILDRVEEEIKGAFEEGYRSCCQGADYDSITYARSVISDLRKENV